MRTRRPLGRMVLRDLAPTGGSPAPPVDHLADSTRPGAAAWASASWRARAAGSAASAGGRDRGFGWFSQVLKAFLPAAVIRTAGWKRGPCLPQLEQALLASAGSSRRPGCGTLKNAPKRSPAAVTSCPPSWDRLQQSEQCSGSCVQFRHPIRATPTSGCPQWSAVQSTVADHEWPCR